MTNQVFSQSLYDVVIVGSGPAGSSAALKLASLGARVAVIEKDKWPRYKVCGGGITWRARNLLGVDISDAVELECKEIKLNFINMDEKNLTNDGFFGHFKVGKNRNLKSKNKSFYDILKENKEKKINVAFYKYCYVDFTKDSDIPSLFEDYEETFKKLKADRFLELEFVYSNLGWLLSKTGP